MDAIKGSVIAPFSGFLVALVFAYTFRIPIPLGGMLGPLGEFSPYAMSFKDVFISVLGAWVFYGMFGGFLLLPIVGAIGGQYAGRKFRHTRNKNRMIVSYAAIASVIPVAGLSILDYIIGPW